MPRATAGARTRGGRGASRPRRPEPARQPAAPARPAPRPLARSARPGVASGLAGLSHVDARGKARMVDVSLKPDTVREARARITLHVRPATLRAIRQGEIAKGDVLGVARLAGIMAAKRTSELIPLCHPIPLSDVAVDFTIDEALPGLRVEATAKTAAQTGVEMEALVAVSVSLVTVYDMAKAVDKSMVIGAISLAEKLGGKSGHWKRSSK